MSVGAVSLLTLKSIKPVLFIVSLLYFINDQLYITETEVPVPDHQEGYSYVPGTPNGPENWGNLSQNWSLCGTGQSQSPIDIQSNAAVFYPSIWSLRTFYQPAQATLVNEGHAVQVQWTGGDAGGIMIGGDEYTLRQCHWHTPSEHTVNGASYEMELHLVHNNTRGEIAVIGILYSLGTADPFLAQIVPYLQSIGTPHQQVGVGSVNPDDTSFDSKRYYRYNGSLTTPPCSENVTWTVIRTVKTVSQDQITALKSVVEANAVENARPVQDLNGRTVYWYRQLFQESAGSEGGYSAAM